MPVKIRLKPHVPFTIAKKIYSHIFLLKIKVGDNYPAVNVYEGNQLPKILRCIHNRSYFKNN